ncbi:hypothetical protein, partial [Rhodococcus sp. (in: high G+C Gram-positive bacteria)]|uniref:hypothetical protein n=1 Tax=Rhodococcus sp. TaxID=1831 RepID=UPI003BAE2406
MLRSHCGAQRYAYNWALAQVKANLDQRTAERSYGISRCRVDPVDVVVRLEPAQVLELPRPAAPPGPRSGTGWRWRSSCAIAWEGAAMAGSPSWAPPHVRKSDSSVARSLSSIAPRMSWYHCWVSR